MKTPFHVMPKGIFLVISLFFVQFAYSQTPILNVDKNHAHNHLRCGTPQLTEEQIRYTLDVVAKQFVGRNSGTTCVPLRAHIVRNTDGSGGISYLDLNKGLANINFVYKAAGIEFFWSGLPDYANNSDYYDYNAQAPDSDTEAGLKALFTVAANAVNIYYVDKIITSSGFEASGYAYYPANTTTSNFILMDKDYHASPVNGTLAHEFGHYFNLAHTFDGTEFGNANANAENVPRSGVNSNCTTKGDLLCDTHADPKGTLVGCTYSGGGVNQTDINGVAYTPPVENIMSYYDNACGVNYFTPQQYTRIAQGLATRLTHNTYSLNASGMAVTNPSGLAATQSGLQAVLNWTDNASNEMGYLIERSTTSASSGFEAITYGATDQNVATFTDASVSAGVTYYYRVKASNDDCNDYSNVATITITAAYCTPTYSNVCFSSGGTGMHINTFTLRTTASVLMLQNSGTGCTSALSDFTNLSANVVVGTTYNVDINFAPVGGGSCYPQNVGIFLDANNDKDYADAGENLAILNYVTNCAVSGTITIPVGTYNGARRLRLRSVYSGEAITSAGSCSSFNYGEAEDYTLNVSGGISLAVDILGFKATKKDEKTAVITWQTGGEKDVKAFVLEVSKDGTHYETLTEFAPKGSVNKGDNYVFEDKTPFNGVNYYRLMEKNLDGTTHFIAQGSVEFKDKSVFKVVPNPTQGTFVLNFYADRSEKADIAIYDVLGRLVLTPQYQTQIGDNFMSIDLPSELNNGFYFVRLQQNGVVKTTRIQKLR